MYFSPTKVKLLYKSPKMTCQFFQSHHIIILIILTFLDSRNLRKASYQRTCDCINFRRDICVRDRYRHRDMSQVLIHNGRAAAASEQPSTSRPIEKGDTISFRHFETHPRPINHMNSLLQLLNSFGRSKLCVTHYNFIIFTYIMHYTKIRISQLYYL